MESTWDSRWVKSVLPHRYPMLLVDRVLEIEPKKRIRAVKCFTINEEFFLGHFPDNPVVPGVILVEAMAQAGGILFLHDLPDRDRKLIYFLGIDRARFRRPVNPGDQVVFDVEALRLRTTSCQMQAKAFVGDQLAAEAVLLSTVVDR